MKTLAIYYITVLTIGFISASLLLSMEKSKNKTLKEDICIKDFEISQLKYELLSNQQKADRKIIGNDSVQIFTKNKNEYIKLSEDSLLSLSNGVHIECAYGEWESFVSTKTSSDTIKIWIYKLNQRRQND